MFPVHPFSAPWKQKTVRFSDVLMFSGGSERGALGTNGLSKEQQKAESGLSKPRIE